MKAVFSIWSGYYHELPTPEDAVLAFLEDGITATELSHEHAQALLLREGTPREIGERFAAFLSRHGFSIPQGHLSYTLHVCSGAAATDELLRQLELFGGIGIGCAVLHCDTFTTASLPLEEKIHQNVLAMRPLVARAEQLGIRICLENLRGDFTGIDSLMRVVKGLDSSNVGICLDTV